MVKKIRPRKPGRPATTGKGTLVGLRCHKPFLDAVDRWRGRQDDKPTRPAAIVRLAERGLMVSPTGRTSAKAASKAADLAANEIDRMTDQSASVEEQATRKRRLLKGPGEFRDIRADHPKKPKP
jgi:hypothetical protein